MSDKFVLSVGQAHQLETALNSGDWTAADLTAFIQNKGLIRRTHEEIRGIPDFIDCDADPFVPEGWSVEEHRKGGKFAVADLKKIQFFLSDGQKGKKCIVGNELRKELKEKPVLNANVLDFWLKHPELIPEELKGKWTFFWGTMYRNSDGNLYVRYLCWGAGQWYWNDNGLVSGWSDQDPAAVPAS